MAVEGVDKERTGGSRLREVSEGATTLEPAAEQGAAPPVDRKAGRRGGWARVRARLPSPYPTLTLAVFLLAWDLFVRVGDVESFLLPPPSDVVVAMADFERFLPDAWVTTQEVLLGFGLSVVVGLLIAVLIVLFRPAQAAIYPLLVAAHVVPKIALAPLFLVWFGFGLFPKILMVFLISFFPIVISTVDGFRSIEIEKLYLSKSMGANWIQTFVRFRIPHALPSIFSGLKVGITLAVIGAVVAEFVGADAGLAFLIVQANSQFDIVTVFAAIGYITAVGVAMFALVELVERLVLPWHVSQRETEATTP